MKKKQKRFRKAIEAVNEAISSAEANTDDPEGRDAALLDVMRDTLARIAKENGFDLDDVG